MAARGNVVGPTVRPAWATEARLAAHRELEVQFRLARRRSTSPEEAGIAHARVMRALEDEDRIANLIEIARGHP